MNVLRRTLGALCIVATPLLHAADDADCQRVRLADVGWTDITMTTAVTRLVLTELGYQPTVRRLSLPDTYRALAEGEIDVFLGNWMPAQSTLLEPQLKNGRIETIQTNLPSARYTLAVLEPGHQKGLKDFADIQRFKKELEGLIYGIEAGNEGNEAIRQMIARNEFGLGQFKLVESSEAAMLRTVEHAQRLDRPLVFLAWEPHPMNERFNLQYLSGGDHYFGPNFGSGQVNTIARTGLTKQCPNLVALLRNLIFSTAAENQMMAELLAGNTNRRRVAKRWLQSNPQVFAQWLNGVQRFDGQPAPTSLSLSARDQ